jgi:hypothetical protein
VIDVFYFMSAFKVFASVNVFKNISIISMMYLFIAAQGLNEASNALCRLSIFDNDEFDIMTQDKVDKSRIHKGKR